MTGRTGLEAGWLGVTPGRGNLYRGAWHINEVYQRLRRFSWPGLPGLPPPAEYATFRSSANVDFGILRRDSSLIGEPTNSKKGIISVFFRPRVLIKIGDFYSTMFFLDHLLDQVFQYHLLV